MQAQEPWIDKLSYDAQVDEWAIEKSNLEREIEELKSRAPGAMPEPAKAQQAEYYRIYDELVAAWNTDPKANYHPKSRLIHAEVVRRMNIKVAS